MISDTKDQLLAVLSNLSSSGFAIGVGFEEFKPLWAHSTYAENWQDYYLSNELFKEDPTITHGTQHTGHFTWAELSKMYPKQSALRKAKRFGLTKGNTISKRVNGVVTIVSLSGPKLVGNDLKLAECATLGLHGLFAPTFEPFDFSDSEIQVLRLLAKGKRDSEIAHLLGVKIETIRKRRTKLYATTNTQSIAELLSLVVKFGVV